MWRILFSERIYFRPWLINLLLYCCFSFCLGADSNIFDRNDTDGSNDINNSQSSPSELKGEGHMALWVIIFVGFVAFFISFGATTAIFGTLDSRNSKESSSEPRPTPRRSVIELCNLNIDDSGNSQYDHAQYNLNDHDNRSSLFSLPHAQIIASSGDYNGKDYNHDNEKTLPHAELMIPIGFDFQKKGDIVNADTKYSALDTGNSLSFDADDDDDDNDINEKNNINSDNYKDDGDIELPLLTHEKPLPIGVNDNNNKSSDDDNFNGISFDRQYNSLDNNNMLCYKQGNGNESALGDSNNGKKDDVMNSDDYKQNNEKIDEDIVLPPLSHSPLVPINNDYNKDNDRALMSSNDGHDNDDINGDSYRQNDKDNGEDIVLPPLSHSPFTISDNYDNNKNSDNGNDRVLKGSDDDYTNDDINIDDFKQRNKGDNQDIVLPPLSHSPPIPITVNEDDSDDGSDRVLVDTDDSYRNNHMNNDNLKQSNKVDGEDIVLPPLSHSIPITVNEYDSDDSSDDGNDRVLVDIDNNDNMKSDNYMQNTDKGDIVLPPLNPFDNFLGNRENHSTTQTDSDSNNIQNQLNGDKNNDYGNGGHSTHDDDANISNENDNTNDIILPPLFASDSHLTPPVENIRSNNETQENGNIHNGIHLQANSAKESIPGEISVENQLDIIDDITGNDESVFVRNDEDDPLQPPQVSSRAMGMIGVLDGSNTDAGDDDRKVPNFEDFNTKVQLSDDTIPPSLPRMPPPRPTSPEDLIQLDDGFDDKNRLDGSNDSLSRGSSFSSRRSSGSSRRSSRSSHRSSRSSRRSSRSSSRSSRSSRRSSRSSRRSSRSSSSSSNS